MTKGVNICRALNNYSINGGPHSYFILPTKYFLKRLGDTVSQLYQDAILKKLFLNKSVDFIIKIKMTRTVGDYANKIQCPQGENQVPST